MLYRVRINLCFDEEDIADGVYEKARSILNKAKKLANGNEFEETFIEIHKCYHDESVNKPCEIIKRIDI